ncbi:MAG: mechanosensitive ion channel family protein [Candidatus Limnocylindrales bacterium]
MKIPPEGLTWLWNLGRDVILPIVLIVVLAILLLAGSRRVIHGLVKAALDRETSEGTARELSAVEVKKRMDTLDTLLTTAIRAFIVIVAVVMILGELNLNIGPAIAGLGIVGIAVGFGAQSLVKDYFNGALILLENQYSKGDVVTIADTTGTVEDFSLRRTTLRDLDGVVHSVPNGQVTVASNRTRTWARINQDVTVVYGTDLEKATVVIDDVGREMAADPLWHRRVLEAPHVERIEALGEYGVTIKILGLVRAPEKWAAGGELRKRLLTAFAANGIEIPRPQRVVLAPSGQPAVEPVAGPTEEELSADSE